MPQLIPAAQYLRMSTEHQQYSLLNQAAAIAIYAETHNFTVVQTYSDPARSGVYLKNRPGLKQLLKDVVEGNHPYRAIMVYDVSRWGRFQDVDESAHYEYLCKSAGVPVHYCAEMFSNSNSLADLVMKAVKRTMAGEFSRELSVKVRNGQRRLASLGYKMGGYRLYGFRRQLLDSQGKPKQILKDGERKSIVNDHVILIPGSKEEISVVKRIFTEFANQHQSARSIAARLNAEGIPFINGVNWDKKLVIRLLQQTRYVGTQVWGKTKTPLSGTVERLPKEQWITCQDACQPIISRDLFDRAQKTLASMTCRQTDDQLLEKLKRVLKRHGRLAGTIIDKSQLCPSCATYLRRFGSLLNAYAKVGYVPPSMRDLLVRQARKQIRNELIAQLKKALPQQIEEVFEPKKKRSLLRYCPTGFLMSVLIAPFMPTRPEKRWLILARPDEMHLTTILALLDEKNAAIKHLYFLPYPMLRARSISIGYMDPAIKSGILVPNIQTFGEIFDRFQHQLPHIGASGLSAGQR